MRANELGDLWFVDHVDVSVNGQYWVVLVITDGASNLLWAKAHRKDTNKTLTTTIQFFKECWEDWKMLRAP